MRSRDEIAMVPTAPAKATLSTSDTSNSRQSTCRQQAGPGVDGAGEEPEHGRR